MNGLRRARPVAEGSVSSMTRVIADISVSLDGFVTGPDPGSRQPCAPGRPGGCEPGVLMACLDLIVYRDVRPIHPVRSSMVTSTSVAPPARSSAKGTLHDLVHRAGVGVVVGAEGAAEHPDPPSLERVGNQGGQVGLWRAGQGVGVGLPWPASITSADRRERLRTAVQRMDGPVCNSTYGHCDEADSSLDSEAMAV
jgi:hypothetical protein